MVNLRSPNLSSWFAGACNTLIGFPVTQIPFPFGSSTTVHRSIETTRPSPESGKSMFEEQVRP